MRIEIRKKSFWKAQETSRPYVWVRAEGLQNTKRQHVAAPIDGTGGLGVGEASDGGVRPAARSPRPAADGYVNTGGYATAKSIS